MLNQIKMSQTENILKHLKRGKRITPLEALNRYGCFRLASRIYDINKLLPAGKEVKMKMVNKGKKSFACYYL